MHTTTTTNAAWRAAGAAAFMLLVSACGGGGEDAGGPAPAPAPPSADQLAFEAQIVSPAVSYQLRWNLNYSGVQLTGTNYATSDYASLAASPRSGAQPATQSTLANLSTTLALPSLAPTRVLKGGKVIVVPGAEGKTIARYVGNDVQVETLADDGVTVAYAQRRTDFSTVALSGTVGAAPAELAHWYNSFWSNAGVLDGAKPFLSGASYTKFSAYNVGDRYGAFDCQAVTTTAAISPCVVGTTLQAALTTGITSNSDGKNYVLADGALRTVDGVPVWVATAPRSISSTLSGTTMYRIYFQLNGNVYTGSLTRDGELMGGSYWLSTPGAATFEERATMLRYQVRLNKAAHDSILAAMKV